MKDEGKYGNRDYYDQFAPNYEKGRHEGYHKLVDDLETDLVLPFAHGATTLEVGCGTGLILERVSRVAAKAVGIDLSPEMVALSRKKGLEATVAPADALPFPDRSFDLVYSFKVLAHVQEIEAALSEMARVARPGARVFIEVYNRHSLRYLIRRLRGGHEIAPGVDDDQVYVRFDTLAEAVARLPRSLGLVRVHGVRIFTILPRAVTWPVFGRALSRVEGLARSGPLGRFGGFLVLECLKAGPNGAPPSPDSRI